MWICRAPKQAADVPAPITRQRPFIIKIGGSLAGSPHLAEWLHALEAIPGQPVVVPGGGPFADAVRTAQGEMGFDDLTAHRMALLAMEQYGLMLAESAPRLTMAATPAAIRRAWRLHQIPNLGAVAYAGPDRSRAAVLGCDL
jgi:aspartokinase-like uncharacterized kinase